MLGRGTQVAILSFTVALLVLSVESTKIRVCNLSGGINRGESLDVPYEEVGEYLENGYVLARKRTGCFYYNRNCMRESATGGTVPSYRLFNNVVVPCKRDKLGVCADGITMCRDGELVCAPFHRSSTEICDGLDNNCDGQVDEDNPGGASCNDGLGWLMCRDGQQICQIAVEPTSDESNVPPPAEICDGIDNNGDGQIDEDGPGAGLACDTGAFGVCSAGITVCLQGQIICRGYNQGRQEFCDGLDNNCNGEVDESDPRSGPCNDGQGWLVCSEGELICRTAVQPPGDTTPPPPTDETCNGVDDNGNGQIDENVPGSGTPCSTGMSGSCSSGSITCVDGGWKCVPYSISEEICDGLDNNCNGEVDESVPQSGPCNDGLGWFVCSDGQLTCRTAVQPPPTPPPPTGELCNGVDDNGNGQIDENVPGSGTPCSTGLSGSCSSGSITCVDGGWKCVPYSMSEEICDGLDNNCNGEIDESDPQSGPCNDGLGWLVCSDGELICQTAVQPPPTPPPPTGEICNGVDDNGNGQIDENVPGGGTPCSTGMSGSCHFGTIACIGGSWKCAPYSASAEICDGLDNDCDGVIDNGLFCN